ncbi:MFS transporter [Paenibacillus mucilaginosus]|uniref:Major facilitator superfamily MFS_1 n=1 Tax=Paenibacillus mucilaginosus (strain KNP414) TaxID=1036673 RepID=F8FG51_PAEMK|nr:MFS transporter [Paenibacillus mucilaginosus]AEI43871.1 major facilitator superfamily MFS_1 [Paenibacillus mucilaginosus KNP414]MCG7212620.1 MFS transporter [Paenibacillus mucilaginosus]WDM25357.1 MFS transporter [Paenibacillus mucilaginosus]
MRMGQLGPAAVLSRSSGIQAAALKVFYFCYFAAYGSLFPYLVPYLEERIVLSGLQAGSLLAVQPLMLIVVQPLWGLLCDTTRQAKGILAAASLCMVASGLALSAADSFTGVVLALVGVASFQCALMPIADSLTMAFSLRTGRTYGSFGLWGAIGFSAGVFVTGRLAGSLGMSVAVWAFVTASVLGLLILLLLPGELGDREVSGSGSGEQASTLSAVLRLLRLPQVWMFLLAALLIMGPVFANNTYFGTYAAGLGGSVAAAGLLMLIAAGSEIPFMQAAERFAARLGLLRLITVAAVFTAVRWYMYLFGLPQPLLYLTLLLQGFSVGLLLPLTIRYIVAAAPQEVRVTAIALYSMMGAGVGNAFCNFAGGLLLHAYSVHAVYLFFAVLATAGVLLLGGIGMIERRSGNKLPQRQASVIMKAGKPERMP